MAAEPVFTNKVLLTIIGALLTLLLTVSGWVWSNQSDRLDKVETAKERQAERTSRLEGDVAGIKTTLDRMDNKLDAILERRPGR